MASGSTRSGRRCRVSQPLIAAVHGDTWNMAHELFLVADVQSQRTTPTSAGRKHARSLPGGGSTVRFPREAGWGNAMRYILTGDHWTAQDAERQEVASTPQSALDKAIQIANKIAACGPLGIKTSLASAQLAIDAAQADALSKLDAQRAALYRTQDSRRAEKQKLKGGRQFNTTIERASHSRGRHSRTRPHRSRCSRQGRSVLLWRARETAMSSNPRRSCATANAAPWLETCASTSLGS